MEVKRSMENSPFGDEKNITEQLAVKKHDNGAVRLICCICNRDASISSDTKLGNNMCLICNSCYVHLKIKFMNKWMNEQQKWYESCMVCMNVVYNSLEFFQHNCSCVNLFWCDLCSLGLSSKEDIIEHVKICNNNLNIRKSSNNLGNLISDDVVVVASTVVHYEDRIKRKDIGVKFAILNSTEKSPGKVAKKTAAAIEPHSTFTCKYCNKAFTKSSTLHNHLRIHTGKPPFFCEYCKKGFKQSGNLHRHVRIHTGEKPFVCEYCKKAFSDLSGLKTHVRIHTGEKPFNCEYCKKAFSDPSTLKNHVRIHTGEKPFVCKYCKKAFSRPSGLKIHIRIHTAEKPFVCGYCKKAFSNSSNLITHVRIHTGEKPFICEYCKMGFKQVNHLDRHVRIHKRKKDNLKVLL